MMGIIFIRSILMTPIKKAKRIESVVSEIPHTDFNGKTIVRCRACRAYERPVPNGVAAPRMVTSSNDVVLHGLLCVVSLGRRLTEWCAPQHVAL